MSLLLIYCKSDVELADQQKAVERAVVEETVAEGPLI